MDEYHFFGKVHPERTNVTISPLNATIALDAPHKLNGSVEYSISASQVAAVFRTDDEVQDIFTLKNIVEELVRVALDALGYTLGCGYDLEISQAVRPAGGSPVVFGVDIPAVRNSAAAAGITLDTIIKTFADARGAFLMAALSDLREAIRSPKDTAFFCYRAIESLRQSFIDAGDAKDNDESWRALRKQLGIERADIDAIKRLADPVRHGRVAAVTDAQRAELFQKTWQVVNQYVLYAAAGYTKAS